MGYQRMTFCQRMHARPRGTQPSLSQAHWHQCQGQAPLPPHSLPPPPAPAPVAVCRCQLHPLLLYLGVSSSAPVWRPGPSTAPWPLHPFRSSTRHVYRHRECIQPHNKPVQRGSHSCMSAHLHQCSGQPPVQPCDSFISHDAAQCVADA